MEKVLFWSLAGFILVLSLLLGKWFSKEAKKIKMEGKPMYHAYFTTPGIIVLICFSMIIVYYFISS
ncbi:MAG: hypothetical protein RBR08_04080 [Desulforegulaceae bacterium]|nr:hypothetical protein [Desulforegulaceae bacterium]